MIGKRFLDIHGSRNKNNKGKLSMNKIEIIKNEVEKFPEPFLDEVLDFVHFLKNKMISDKLATAFASESSLKKDWLRPKEDEAWQNL
jgi:hypothetical protein